MKNISAFFYCLIFVLSLGSFSASGNDLTAGDPKIAGTLTYNKMKPGDQFDGKVVLELYQGDELFAQTAILKPRFPQAYLIGPKNAVTPGVPFKGEFKLVAKLMQENGSKVAEAQRLKVLAGTRNIMLILSENQSN